MRYLNFKAFIILKLSKNDFKLIFYLNNKSWYKKKIVSDNHEEKWRNILLTIKNLYASEIAFKSKEDWLAWMTFVVCWV